MRISREECIILKQMLLDQKQLIKPIRKFRKAIKKLLMDPGPEQVHGLRTQSRRLEATLHALKLDGTKRGQRLLRSITPIRKAAGKVRDVDVLTSLASTILHNEKGPGEDLVQLLEALGARRLKSAKRLRRIVRDGRKRALRRLRWLSVRIDQWIKNVQQKNSGDETGGEDPAAFVISRSDAVSSWTNLNRHNLHSYRLEIKQLRYVLELGEHPDNRLLKALEETKDSIGEWHDWCELETLARELFWNGELVGRIHSIADRRFSDALRVATNLQKKYLLVGRC